MNNEVEVNLFLPLTESPSDYIALTDERVGPFGPSTPRACFTISITQDSVCEGGEGGEGGEEVFSAVLRNDESMVEVIASGSVASITIEDSAVCSEFYTPTTKFHNSLQSCTIPNGCNLSLNLPPPSVPVVLGFEQLSYTVRETDGSAELCVNITEPALLRRNVTLTVDTLPRMQCLEYNADTIGEDVTVALLSSNAPSPSPGLWGSCYSSTIVLCSGWKWPLGQLLQ